MGNKENEEHEKKWRQREGQMQIWRVGGRSIASTKYIHGTQGGSKKLARRKKKGVCIFWFPFLLSIFSFRESVNILFTNCCGGLSGW